MSCRLAGQLEGSWQRRRISLRGRKHRWHLRVLQRGLWLRYYGRAMRWNVCFFGPMPRGVWRLVVSMRQRCRFCETSSCWHEMQKRFLCDRSSVHVWRRLSDHVSTSLLHAGSDTAALATECSHSGSSSVGDDYPFRSDTSAIVAGSRISALWIMPSVHGEQQRVLPRDNGELVRSLRSVHLVRTTTKCPARILAAVRWFA
jgi:hypothetical protein